MHHLRYNLAGALGAILFVAVGFAALREADELWDSWLFSLTLGLLLFAVLLAAHRTGDKRAFWIGFALFGWGYLSLSLIPSTEPRLITTKAIESLHQSRFFGIRMYVLRVIADLDRMRAHNLSPDDLQRSFEVSRMLGPPEQEQIRQGAQTVEYVQGSCVLGVVVRFNNPESYEKIVLKSSSEGEILWLKDVAKVERGSKIFIPGPVRTTYENFIHIGHTLCALLAAWLGGVLFRRLRSVSRAPDESKVRRALEDAPSANGAVRQRGHDDLEL